MSALVESYMTDCCLWSCSITDGMFGEAEYFQGLVDNVNDMSKSNDWFLLANDFASYMDAQKQVDQVRHCRSGMLDPVHSSEVSNIMTSLLCNLVLMLASTPCMTTACTHVDVGGDNGLTPFCLVDIR